MLITMGAGCFKYYFQIFLPCINFEHGDKLSMVSPFGRLLEGVGVHIFTKDVS